jgi:hypothetical protein
MNFTYFASANGGPLVELDEELAIDLYKVACRDKPEHNRRDEESDEEWLTRNTARATELLEAGAKMHIDDGTYIFGVELSTKERFKFLLKNGVQTREEFAESQCACKSR